VWSGSEVLVWGGHVGGTSWTEPANDGAAYDPRTQQWRFILLAPIGGRAGHEAVWSGEEMIVWGGFPRCCSIDSVIHDLVAAAYDL
jgi:N-acetylneuraminic acid mutarotase